MSEKTNIPLRKFSKQKKELFLVEFSGDLPEFGLLELKSILEAHNYLYNLNEIERKTLFGVEVNPFGAWLLTWRGAYIKRVSQILGSLKDIDLGELFNELTEEYRIHLAYRLRKKKDREILLKIYKDVLSKINYRRPKPIRKIELTLDKIDDTIYLLKEIGSGREKIGFRNPKYRSYAPAATMDAYISRALVNFSRVTPGNVFLDPFAGSGSIALEASSIGAFTIASDLSLKHLLGLYLNAKLFGFDVKILVADATKMPFEDSSVDALATDPPYGRSASTFKRELKDVYLGFLSEAARVLKKGRFLVFCSPTYFDLDLFIGDFGFEIVSKLVMRVHKSLGRNIYVLTLL